MTGGGRGNRSKGTSSSSKGTASGGPPGGPSRQNSARNDRGGNGHQAKDKNQNLSGSSANKSTGKPQNQAQGTPEATKAPVKSGAGTIESVKTALGAELAGTRFRKDSRDKAGHNMTSPLSNETSGTSATAEFRQPAPDRSRSRIKAHVHGPRAKSAWPTPDHNDPSTLSLPTFSREFGAKNKRHDRSTSNSSSTSSTKPDPKRPSGRPADADSESEFHDAEDGTAPQKQLPVCITGTKDVRPLPVKVFNQTTNSWEVVEPANNADQSANSASAEAPADPAEKRSWADETDMDTLPAPADKDNTTTNQAAAVNRPANGAKQAPNDEAAKNSSTDGAANKDDQPDVSGGDTVAAGIALLAKQPWTTVSRGKFKPACTSNTNNKTQKNNSRSFGNKNVSNVSNKRAPQNRPPPNGASGHLQPETTAQSAKTDRPQQTGDGATTQFVQVPTLANTQCKGLNREELRQFHDRIAKAVFDGDDQKVTQLREATGLKCSGSRDAVNSFTMQPGFLELWDSFESGSLQPEALYDATIVAVREHVVRQKAKALARQKAMQEKAEARQNQNQNDSNESTSTSTSTSTSNSQGKSHGQRPNNTPLIVQPAQVQPQQTASPGAQASWSEVAGGATQTVRNKNLMRIYQVDPNLPKGRGPIAPEVWWTLCMASMDMTEKEVASGNPLFRQKAPAANPGYAKGGNYGTFVPTHEEHVAYFRQLFGSIKLDGKSFVAVLVAEEPDATVLVIARVHAAHAVMARIKGPDFCAKQVLQAKYNNLSDLAEENIRVVRSFIAGTVDNPAAYMHLRVDSLAWERLCNGNGMVNVLYSTWTVAYKANQLRPGMKFPLAPESTNSTTGEGGEGTDTPQQMEMAAQETPQTPTPTTPQTPLPATANPTATETVAVVDNTTEVGSLIAAADGVVAEGASSQAFTPGEGNLNNNNPPHPAAPGGGPPVGTSATNNNCVTPVAHPQHQDGHGGQNGK